VTDRRGERHLALPLLFLPVRNRRAGFDRAEPVRRAGLEEHRLEERRLSDSTVADDGDVADLSGLDSGHARGSSWCWDVAGRS
jgi:hypothetical protein